MKKTWEPCLGAVFAEMWRSSRFILTVNLQDLVGQAAGGREKPE